MALVLTLISDPRGGASVIFVGEDVNRALYSGIDQTGSPAVESSWWPALGERRSFGRSSSGAFASEEPNTCFSRAATGSMTFEFNDVRAGVSPIVGRGIRDLAISGVMSKVGYRLRLLPTASAPVGPEGLERVR